MTIAKMGWFTIFFTWFTIYPILVFSTSQQSFQNADEIQNLFLKNHFTAARGMDVTVYDNEFKRAMENGTLKNLIILMPGTKSYNALIQEQYIKEHCHYLRDSFYTYEQYIVICFNWKPYEKTAEKLLNAARWKGRELAHFIDKYFTESRVQKIHFYAHNSGTLLAQAVAKSLIKRPPNFIFGIDQRDDKDLKKSDLILTKNSAKTVELINTIRTNLPKGHRNFFIFDKTFDKHFVIYKAVAQVIATNGDYYKGISCPNADEFLKGECNGNPKASIWSNELIENPFSEQYGNFYVTKK